MIWGMTLRPGVEYSRKVTKEEHLTLASLDCRPQMNNGVYHPLAHLVVKVNKCEHVLCYLEKGQAHQQSLDFVFEEGDNLVLSVEGTGILHITGYSVKHTMPEDSHIDKSMIYPVRPVLDKTQDNMDSAISFEDQPETSDSNSTLKKHRLRDNCRSSERHFQQPSLEKEIKEEPDQGKEDQTLYQNVKFEEIDGPAVFQNSEGAEFLHYKPDLSGPCFQASNERTVCLENSSSQETSIEVTDDCGNSKEDGNDLELREATFSTKACLSTHEDKSNQGMEISGADTDDTSHSGLCFDNDEENIQPHSTEPDVTQSGDELPAIDISHRETSADANEEENDCQTSTGTLQKSGVKTREKSLEFLLRGETGKQQSHSTSTVRVHANRKRSLKSLEVRTAQQPQKSKTSEPATSESNSIEGEETSINRSQYKCTLLKKTFWRRATHSDKNRFLCQFCGKLFTKIQSLHTHERIHNSNRPLECQFCGKVFFQKIELILHERKHEIVKKPLQPYSSQTNIVKRNVSQQTRVCNAGIPFQCQYCEKGFTSKDGVIRHERYHAVEKAFQCQFCPKRFISKSHVSEHERIHTGERPFKCQFCEKAFVQKSHRTQHERIHTGEKPYKCQFCESRFISKAYVTRHERKSHPSESPFKCQFCPNRFTTKSQLKQHEGIHTDEGKFKGSFYNQTSGSKEAHERVQTKKKTFKCSFCPERYTQKSHKTVHEKSHTNEIPFKCSLGEKRFASKLHVVRHQKTHTAGREFKCSFCHKAFQSSSNRIVHERIHTNERPYKCSFCAQRFRQQSHVISHERRHTNEKPFKCSFCEAKFAQKSSLNSHERVHTEQIAVKTKA